MTMTKHIPTIEIQTMSRVLGGNSGWTCDDMRAVPDRQFDLQTMADAVHGTHARNLDKHGRQQVKKWIRQGKDLKHICNDLAPMTFKH
jgi:hypothetical protein